MRAQRVTIKDLAKHLNLSISTISRAFNDKYDIKPETKEMILEAAKEIGYRPNPIARKLHSGQSFNIGVIVPELTETSFFTKAITGMQEELLPNDYHPIIMQSMGNPETELEILKALELKMVDGIIISMTDEFQNTAYINNIIKQGTPVILFNRGCREIQAPQVVFDDYKWPFFATEHIIRQGYKKIYHFATPKNLSVSRSRVNGFKNAMKKHKLEVTDDMIIESGFTIDIGQKLSWRLLENGTIPEAIFAASDRVAIGAIKEFRSAGFRIPEDIGIMGFSESTLANVFEPSLTSVAQPIHEIGRKSAEMIVKIIESDAQYDPETVVLSGKLNIRESTSNK